MRLKSGAFMRRAELFVGKFKVTEGFEIGLYALLRIPKRDSGIAECQ